MASQPEQEKVEPKTIYRHAYGVYPSMAMLAGMQLDVFTPLKEGPMSGARLAEALDVPQEKLRPLLYALVNAELLRIEDDQFANTPEGDLYLVCGRSTYLGGAHELYSDLWSAALAAGQSIRAGAPHKKHDFAAMSDAELAAFFRGLHPGRWRPAASWLQAAASPVSDILWMSAAAQGGGLLLLARIAPISARQCLSCRGSPKLRDPSSRRRA
jgi:hypothetical protein